MKAILLIAGLLMALASLPAFAQTGPPLTGTVLDGKANEGVPGASVYSKLRPQNGTATDAEGKFVLRLSGLPADTLLVVSCVGFQTQTLRWRPGQGSLRVRLQAAQTELGEVVVKPGENPAYAIIRRAVARKEQNSIGHLPAYELTAYNRLELLLTNTGALQNSRALRPVRELMERQGPRYRDARGRLLLPLSRTETVSTTYYRRQPREQKEAIARTRTVGLGLEAGDGVAQLLSGSGFRDYDLYQNSVRILNQSLPSPLADTWRLHYEFWLEDSVRIAGEFCYRLGVEPRRPTDLVFTGTIWVTKADYALRRVDLRLSPKSHLNFVDGLRLRQEGERQANGTWLARTVDYAIALNLKDLSEALPGVRMQLHTDNRRLAVTEPQSSSFYADAAPEPDRNTEADTAFWRSYRAGAPAAPALAVVPPDSTATPVATAPAADSLDGPTTSYGLLDSLRALPAVRAYTYVGRTLATGYASLGKVELGYLPGTYAYNNIEGSRLALGLRTTPTFSRNLNLEGTLAYGTKDQALKYNLAVSQVLSRTRYTVIGVRTRSDLVPLAQLGAGYVATPILLALNRWGNLRQRNPFAFEETTLWLEQLLRPGLTGSFTLRNLNLAPLYPRGVLVSEEPALAFGTARTIRADEATFSLRFTRNERAVLLRNNQRRALRQQPSPTFTAAGVLGRFDGGTGYQKLTAGVEQRQFPVFGLGLGDLTFQAGWVFGTTPYALLKVHQGGGPGPFLFRDATQTLSSFELVSDHWAELHYTHYFNDLILGQLPGVRALNRRLGWRLLATSSVLWGGLRSENARANELTAADGKTYLPFRTLRSAVPYVELGYGVENIFKVLRVDFVHRLTYRTPEAGASPFDGGRFVVKLSGAIKL
ncbi:DUF5686 and carboxypeptidase-like regulatory domain-containing protein [Hymenobacter terrenus]|uniref:DUF5686 and carboxypeptidase-like regulatory domain-containing protein n=1 Tax=Hymenobacter terrenus TaxID=1629124 RepID=UPI0009E35F55|nr:DUF5686 and carboxypeptidase-like regulatory domain-containing protein [Hymenobacter terrenus]